MELTETTIWRIKVVMKRMGRPKEKEDSSKLTLYLEDSVIAILEKLAEENKTSRSRIVEQLVRNQAAHLDNARRQGAGENERHASQHKRTSSTVPSDAIALAHKAEEKHDRGRRRS